MHYERETYKGVPVVTVFIPAIVEVNSVKVVLRAILVAVQCASDVRRYSLYDRESLKEGNAVPRCESA